MITICKLFNISLVKNGTHLHQGAKVLLPACLLSAVCFAVVNSTKDLAALKMPLSILHCQKNYLSCSKQTHHQKAQTLTVCIAGITSFVSPNINWGKASELYLPSTSAASYGMYFCKVEVSTPHKEDWWIEVPQSLRAVVLHCVDAVRSASVASATLVWFWSGASPANEQIPTLARTLETWKPNQEAGLC